MSLYFFRVNDGHDRVNDGEDRDRIELPGREEAREHARMVANELTRNGGGTMEITIRVTDEDDNPLFEVIGVG